MAVHLGLGPRRLLCPLSRPPLCREGGLQSAVHVHVRVLVVRLAFSAGGPGGSCAPPHPRQFASGEHKLSPHPLLPFPSSAPQGPSLHVRPCDGGRRPPGPGGLLHLTPSFPRRAWRASHPHGCGVTFVGSSFCLPESAIWASRFPLKFLCFSTLELPLVMFLWFMSLYWCPPFSESPSLLSFPLHVGPSPPLDTAV